MYKQLSSIIYQININPKMKQIMKRNGYTTLVAIAVLTLASCGDEKKKQAVETDATTAVEAEKDNAMDLADASFSNEMAGNVYQNYLMLRTALVNSDASDVQKAASNLVGNFTEDEAMKTIAQQLTETDDLEKQRQLFSDFTAQVEPLFKNNITEGAIYKQFCPMAFNGDGGYWFSNVEQIRNPYYGDKMLKCGEITETIQ